MNRKEVCISGWSSASEPYIESARALSDYYVEESQEFVVFDRPFVSVCVRHTRLSREK